MEIVTGTILVVFTIGAILLVLIILAQDDGADGAGMIFGSAASQQYGVRQGNIITKTTSILAGSFLILAFVLAFLLKGGDNTSALQEAAREDGNVNDTAIEWWQGTPEGTNFQDNKNDLFESPASVNGDSNNGIDGENPNTE